MYFRCPVAGTRLTDIRQAQQTCSIAHLFHLPPLPFHEVFHHWQEGFALPLDVEIIIDVCLSKVQIVRRQEHLAQRTWMLEHQCAARWLCRFGFPGGAIPQSYS